MSNLVSRLFTGPADLQAMIDLTGSLRARGQKVYPIAADLYEELADQTTQESTRLWENARGELVGFVYVSPYQNMVYVFDENEFTSDIEAELVDWSAEAMRSRNRQTGQCFTLDASALENDLLRVAFLERHAFERQAESSILMARSLEQDIPEPQLPPGFSIRPLRGAAEVEAYVALHQAAFGTEYMTTEFRKAIMDAPDYLPDLDLVAVAPDGTLAAYCVCQIFPDDAPRAGGKKEGWTDPVGTHPAYRRLGLARALILTGMHLLKQRGMDTALLGTSSNNIAMQSIAETAGYRRVSNTLLFCRNVN